MTSNKRLIQNLSTKERFISEGYAPATTGDIYWRKITEQEYQSVPNMYKSKSRLFLTVPGIALIIEIIIFVCAITSVIGGIIHHEEHAWFGLFLYFMLMLLFGSLTIVSLLDKLDRIVTRDSLVNTGEVAEIEPAHSSKRGETIDAFHTIAVPCFGKLITVMDRPVVYAPSTVLVVRSPSMKYHLLPIPRSSADFTTAVQDLRDEMSSISSINEYDYRDYTKAGSFDIMADTHPLSEAEFSEIPDKYRKCNIFANKPLGIIWCLITFIIIVLILSIVHLHNIQDDMFAPMIAGTVPVILLDLLMTNLTFHEGKAMRIESGFSSDCIPVKRMSADGKYYIAAIVPEKKLFIEQIQVSPEVHCSIPLNVPVRLYFKDRVAGVVHFRTERY